MTLALNERAAVLAIGVLGTLCGVAVAFGGITSFYVCAALIACVALLVDFRVGVVLLILLMPLSGSSTIFPHELFGIVGLNPVNVLLVGTLVSFLVHSMRDRNLHSLVPRPLLWLYAVPIVIAGVLGMRHVGEISPALIIDYPDLNFPDGMSYLRDIVMKPMLLVVFALLVSAAVARTPRPERFLVPAVVAMFVVAAAVVAYVVHSGVPLSVLASSDSREFLSALGMHANDFGHLYATAFALLLFTGVAAERPAARAALLSAAALAAVALVLTFSRGAFVALAVVCGLFLLWRFSVKLMIVATLATVVVLLFPPDAIYERLTAGQGAGLNAITSGRLDNIWTPLIPELLRHPLIGNGIGSILWSDPMRRGAGELIPLVTHPHSAYLAAALDMGVVGLVLLCAYFVHVFRQLLQLARDPTIAPPLRGFFQGAAAGLAGILVADCTDSTLIPSPEQVFLWFAIGMMYGELARRSAASATGAVSRERRT